MTGSESTGCDVTLFDRDGVKTQIRLAVATVDDIVHDGRLWVYHPELAERHRAPIYCEVDEAVVEILRTSARGALDTATRWERQLADIKSGKHAARAGRLN